MEKDFQESFPSLEGYENKWVALSNDESRIIAADESFARAAEKARAQGEAHPVLLKVNSRPDPKTQNISGAKMEPEKIIKEMTRLIASKFSPEKIILFGSRVSANAAPDSDVDLLVVVREAKDRRALRLAMRRAVNGLGLAKDIVVMTSKEFEAKRKIPGTIAYPADTEGKLLYAQ